MCGVIVQTIVLIGGKKKKKKTFKMSPIILYFSYVRSW